MKRRSGGGERLLRGAKSQESKEKSSYTPTGGGELIPKDGVKEGSNSYI